MNHIEQFVKDYWKAREAWEKSGRDYHAWLVFYETKVELHRELAQHHPEIKFMEYFWDVMRDNGPLKAQKILSAELKAIHKGLPCRDCPEIVIFPAIRCPKCAEEYRLLQKERREVKKRINKR